MKLPASLAELHKCWKTTLLLAGAAVLAVSCASPPPSSDEAVDVNDDVRSAIAAEGEIVLAQMNWTNQQVNTEMARRVLTAIGANVTVQALDDTTVFAAMAETDNMVDMVVFRPTAQKFWDEFITEKKTVTQIGDTGYETVEGWYVPTYVIEGDSARGIEPVCPGLPDYRAINDCAAAFATPSTDGKARYLAGDPAWEPLFGDKERIQNLGLNVTQEYAGSEAALVAEFKRALDRGEPVMGLMWNPHMLFAKYDLTLVDMPPYSDECWGTTYACAWEMASNSIVASADFAAGHPVATKLFEGYSLSADQNNEIMLRIEEEGLTVEEAVDQWMTANESVWQSWIPASV
jgi:glycine betaine/proline transport system substrate-binding protein